MVYYSKLGVVIVFREGSVQYRTHESMFNSLTIWNIRFLQDYLLPSWWSTSLTVSQHSWVLTGFAASFPNCDCNLWYPIATAVPTIVVPLLLWSFSRGERHLGFYHGLQLPLLSPSVAGSLQLQSLCRWNLLLSYSSYLPLLFSSIFSLLLLCSDTHSYVVTLERRSIPRLPFRDLIGFRVRWEML